MTYPSDPADAGVSSWIKIDTTNAHTLPFVEDCEQRLTRLVETIFVAFESCDKPLDEAKAFTATFIDQM